MQKPRKKILVVDGYNILNAWRRDLKQVNIQDAREDLLHQFADYAGFTGQQVIVVFDAWQSDRRMRTREMVGPVELVYTQKGETADHYIERLCDSYAHDMEIGRCEIRVATSDGTEQTVILGRGATRISAREMLYEMNETHRTSRQMNKAPITPKKTTVMEHLPQGVREKLERMRRGE